MRPDVATADEDVTNRQQQGARGVQGSVKSREVRDRDHTRLFNTGHQYTKKNCSLFRAFRLRELSAAVRAAHTKMQPILVPTKVDVAWAPSGMSIRIAVLP